MKFTREQIKDQVFLIILGDLFISDSTVYQQWAEYADNHESGFKGFNERTLNEIIADFHLNDGLVDPLSDEDFNALLLNGDVVYPNNALLNGDDEDFVSIVLDLDADKVIEQLCDYILLGQTGKRPLRSEQRARCRKILNHLFDHPWIDDELRISICENIARDTGALQADQLPKDN
jgi:hypothetical protein